MSYRNRRNQIISSFDKQSFSIPPDWYVGNVPIEQKGRLDQSERARFNFNLTMPNVPSAWRELNGQGIKIAILDTGIDVNHSALTAQVRKNFTGGAEDDVRDEEGHGTMVAGVIAARGASTTIVGVAPEASLFVGKVIKRSSGGAVGALRDGIHWAVEQKVDVINISLGRTQDSQAIQSEVIAAARQGIFVICAAGNGGSVSGVDFPARHSRCIAVGAVTRQGNRWKVSPSEGSAIGRELDIMALGANVRSTFPTTLGDQSGEAVGQGTSLAAPFVTGVVALALAKHRILGGNTSITTLEELTEHLRRTAIDLPPDGVDPQFGHGIINLESFLASLDRE